jgi:hypothetical protein
VTHQHFRDLVSDEDRQTYRKWMRSLVFVYGSIVVLVFGAASFRTHQNFETVKAAAKPLSVASQQFDR